jgi:hypothetical protein
MRNLSYYKKHTKEGSRIRVTTGFGKYASKINQCLDKPIGLQEVEDPIINKW